MTQANRRTDDGMTKTGEKVLSLLGMARRARVLLIGQDQVLSALPKGIFMIRTEDCSAAVLRKIEPSLRRGSACCVLQGVSREELGRSLGIQSAQIAALPMKSGFTKKLAEMLQAGGALHE